MEETRLHRFWWCPHWEHLRSPEFRDIRDLYYNLLPACVTHCGIAPKGFDLFDVAILQEVFLRIELAEASRWETWGEGGPPPPEGP